MKLRGDLEEDLTETFSVTDDRDRFCMGGSLAVNASVNASVKVSVNASVNSVNASVNGERRIEQLARGELENSNQYPPSSPKAAKHK